MVEGEELVVIVLVVEVLVPELVEVSIELGDLLFELAEDELVLGLFFLVLLHLHCQLNILLSKLLVTLLPHHGHVGVYFLQLPHEVVDVSCQFFLFILQLIDLLFEMLVGVLLGIQ